MIHIVTSIKHHIINLYTRIKKVISHVFITILCTLEAAVKAKLFPLITVNKIRGTIQEFYIRIICTISLFIVLKPYLCLILYYSFLIILKVLMIIQPDIVHCEGFTIDFSQLDLDEDLKERMITSFETEIISTEEHRRRNYDALETIKRLRTIQGNTAPVTGTPTPIISQTVRATPTSLIIEVATHPVPVTTPIVSQPVPAITEANTPTPSPIITTPIVPVTPKVMDSLQEIMTIPDVINNMESYNVITKMSLIVDHLEKKGIPLYTQDDLPSERFMQLLYKHILPELNVKGAYSDHIAGLPGQHANLIKELDQIAYRSNNKYLQTFIAIYNQNCYIYATRKHGLNTDMPTVLKIYIEIMKAYQFRPQNGYY